MSNSQYETFGLTATPYAPYAPYEPPYGPYESYENPEPYADGSPGSPPDGPVGPPGGSGDTYRPAYEEASADRTTQVSPATLLSQAPTEPQLPRQEYPQGPMVASTDPLDPVGAEAATAELRTGGRAQARRAARRAPRRRGVTERADPLRRLLPQALVVAFLAAWAPPRSSPVTRPSS